MSICLASVMEQAGRPHSDAISAYPGYSLASITAATTRKLNQLVSRDPLDSEPAHGVVVGQKSRRVARLLRDKANWVVKPVQLLYP